MTGKFTINGTGSLKVVEPEEWRGMIFSRHDNSFNCHLHPHPDTSISIPDQFSDGNGFTVPFNIQVYYQNKWRTPLHVVENPTFISTKTYNSFDSSNSTGFDYMTRNSGTETGVALSMYGFDNAYRENIDQNIEWTGGNDYFTFDRNNNINGNGMIHWKFNGVAINLGEVVLFAED